MLLQPLVKRRQFRRRIAHPEGKRGSVDVDALHRKHLRLAIERQVPAVFGDDHAGHHRLGGKTRLDEMIGCVLLHHLFAGPAGKLRTMRDDHAILGGKDVQPLARLLADHMHRRIAARAVGARWRHRLVDARQMVGQCAALACPRARQPRLFLLLGRLGLRERCFDVFEGELELVGRKPFEPFVPRAKAVIVRLAKKVMHMLVEALQPVALGLKLCFLDPLGVALGNRNIALCNGFQRQRAQALNIVGKRIGRAHTRSRTQSRANAMHFLGG